MTHCRARVEGLLLARSTTVNSWSSTRHFFHQLRPALLDYSTVFQRKHVGLWERLAPMERFTRVNQHPPRGIGAGFFLRRRQPRVEVLGPDRLQDLHRAARIRARTDRPQDIP